MCLFSWGEFVLLSYLIGISVLMWSMSVSCLGLYSLLILVPFCSLWIKMFSNMSYHGVLINETKKIIVLVVMGVVVPLLLISTLLWMTSGLFGVGVLGVYVIGFVGSGYVLIISLGCYLTLVRSYKVISIGVLPLPLLFLKIGISPFLLYVVMLCSIGLFVE